MSLLGKVRVLVGALVHRPFRPSREKIDLDAGQGLEEAQQADHALEADAVDLPDRERVADLIARQQRDAG
jgi:hypothetical protein